jgi:hypothetical protein
MDAPVTTNERPDLLSDQQDRMREVNITTFIAVVATFLPSAIIAVFVLLVFTKMISSDFATVVASGGPWTLGVVWTISSLAAARRLPQVETFNATRRGPH